LLVVCNRPSVNQLGEKVAEPCTRAARFDVLYRLRVEPEPRGAWLCLQHFEELKQLKMRDLIADWSVRLVR